jgi:hypothetical protein
LSAGAVPEPKRVEIGGTEVRIWSEKDLAKVKAYALTSPKLQKRKEREKS